MSQIDRLNFLPHIFWFIVLFAIFYFIVFSYILPLIYKSLETRSMYFNSLLTDTLKYSTFFHFFLSLYNNRSSDLLVKLILTYFKQLKNILVLNSSFRSTIFFNV